MHQFILIDEMVKHWMNIYRQLVRVSAVRNGAHFLPMKKPGIAFQVIMCANSAISTK